MFAQGDMAVYPAYGVGRIEAIETKSIGGADQSFYIMRILKTGMTVMVPTATSQNVGLRSIITPEEVDQVMAILRDHDVTLVSQSWNRRKREYEDKIKTGSAFDVAEVLRELCLLRANKQKQAPGSGRDLSYGERTMLDKAMALLVKEIALARDMEESAVVELIEQIYA